MHHRLIRIVVVPAVLLVLSLLSAPGAGAPKSSWDAKSCGRVGGTLVFGQAQDAVTLDPHDATDGFSVNNTSNAFDTLVRFRPDTTQVEPSLAESWTVSADGLVWTFKLRRGVRFHDGTPFNSEAVVFNYQRQADAKHPYHHGAFEYAGFTFQNVKSVTAVDAQTVRFTLSARFA
ncbi:MAG: ABC transporter substrate-binding protein, partial [Armatimonadetes bacterium]|nr:ABC transporter substrate-binding protein [Armatimonadota bacterium]